MKLLEKLIDRGKITSDELKEIGWCCVHYQRSIPLVEDCRDSCPANKGVGFIRFYDHADTLCDRCRWRNMEIKIPKDLQEYSYIYNLGPKEVRRAHPDFQKFFNQLKEKFERLCEKASRVLRRCHDKYNCSSCPLRKVCIYN